MVIKYANSFILMAKNKYPVTCFSAMKNNTDGIFAGNATVYFVVSLRISSMTVLLAAGSEGTEAVLTIRAAVTPLCLI